MELGQTRSATALIPGSPGAVRQTAEGWKAHGTTAAQVHDQLATLDDEGTWTGEAYLTRFDRQLLHWSNAGDGLREGAHALFTWADALEWAQEEAARAITLWDEAEQQAATALAAHRAYVRELRVGQGLRHPEVEVPFVDPSGPAHEQAREVLFHARATLDVFARDCAVRLDQAAEAARMPLTEAEAATAAQHAVTEAVFTLAIVQPFQATMDMLAVSAQTLGAPGHHPRTPRRSRPGHRRRGHDGRRRSGRRNRRRHRPWGWSGLGWRPRSRGRPDRSRTRCRQVGERVRSECS